MPNSPHLLEAELANEQSWNVHPFEIGEKECPVSTGLRH